jgi:hypothetical protein
MADGQWQWPTVGRALDVVDTTAGLGQSICKPSRGS